MIKSDMQCYIKADRFFHWDFHYRIVHPLSVNVCRVSFSSSNQIDWKTRKNIIDKVHCHLCGHSNFDDIKTLLERNKIRDDYCTIYLKDLLETCVSFHVMSLPTKMRSVSLNNSSRRFNQLCLVDFLYLDDLQLFHCMDCMSRYSLAVFVETLTMRDAIAAFEQSWVSLFRVPESVQADDAFPKSEFKEYLKSIGCKL